VEKHKLYTFGNQYHFFHFLQIVRIKKQFQILHIQNFGV